MFNSISRWQYSVGQKFIPQSNFGLLIVRITFDNSLKKAYRYTLCLQKSSYFLKVTLNFL